MDKAQKDKSDDHKLENEGFKIFNNPSWRMELSIGIHAKYCKYLIFGLCPEDYEEYDMSKLTFLHFSLSSLDLLQQLDTITSIEKEHVINTIYSLMVLDPPETAGFVASKTLIFDNSENVLPIHLQPTHVTMTFSALVSLLTLGDDLKRVNRQKLLRGIAFLQNKDGSFNAGPSCSENDLRFIYSAIAVCYILNDFSYINTSKVVEHIKKSLSFEGSFGAGPLAEGHAAFTFCAIASLVLLDKLNALSKEELERILQWCCLRQINGFTGRPNKDEDTCYSFWIGGTLQMLGKMELTDLKANIDYILHNQNPIIGGIGKHDNEFTDPLHTFMGIAGLSLSSYNNLNPLFPPLAISLAAAEHLKNIHTNLQ